MVEYGKGGTGISIERGIVETFLGLPYNEDWLKISEVNQECEGCMECIQE